MLSVLGHQDGENGMTGGVYEYFNFIDLLIYNQMNE